MKDFLKGCISGITIAIIAVTITVLIEKECAASIVKVKASWQEKGKQ